MTQNSENLNSDFKSLTIIPNWIQPVSQFSAKLLSGNGLEHTCISSQDESKFSTKLHSEDGCNSTQTTEGSSHKLFLPGIPEKNQKLFDVTKMIAWSKDAVTVKKNKKIEYLNVQYIDSEDTEFYTPLAPLSQVSRVGLSTQCKGIHPDAPKKIFWHPTHAKELNEARVKVGLEPLSTVKSEAHFVDYLNSCGTRAKIVSVKEGEDLNKLPVFTWTRNAHFDTAELLMVVSGKVKNEVIGWIRNKVIIARRRLLIENFVNNSKKSEDWVQFESVVLEIDGIRYALRLRIIDTCAIHGVAGYGDIAANVGWTLTDKDKLSKKDKAKMLDIALTRPKDFEDYALGDLDVWDILAMYDVKWREIYLILGLEKYYQEPALTIGASVRDLFCAVLANKLDIGSTDKKGKFRWREQFDEQVKPFLDFNATEIRSWVKSTAVLLCKVEGGRCRNNRPKTSFIKRKTSNGYDATYDQNIIIDIDISGCYGEGQRNQMFFLGHPAVMDLDLRQNKERYNMYPIFREVLKSLGVKVDVLVKAAKNKDIAEWNNPDNWGELVSGGWMMRASTSESLKYGQDFYASWFTSTGYRTNIMAKFIKESLSTDSEIVDSVEQVNFDEKYGTTKIFEHEIHNGIITHDGLQWILAVASDRQRNELLDKLCVMAGVYYPRSMQVKPTKWHVAIQELSEVYTNWEGKNTFEITNAKTGAIQHNYNSCHAWIGINLGELIVDKLLIERKKAQIKFKKKSPLDQLFKLIVNTLYGDMVSPYFIISNPIVGNNITARARALAWYMEKGLNGIPSITDGCPFEANEVLKNNYENRNEINGESINSVRDKKLSTRKITTKPLGDVDEILMNESGELFIRMGDNLISIDKGSDNKFINEEAMRHLQSLFPCVDVLHASTTKLDVNEKTLEPVYTSRKGQFSFETKDAYVAGGFHGSANYIFMKVDGTTIIKMRGYETSKVHEAWEFGKDSNEDFEDYLESFIKTERYGEDNTPGKDFMNQLLNNPQKIKRQQTAIKEGIFKVGEYAENFEKFDTLGIVPGDNIKRKMLMQEFSLSQFTFKTYEQYMNWHKVVGTDKDENKQSIETFFLDKDGDLNFVKMTEWVADAIERGVMNPYNELDKHNNKERDKECTHPSLNEYISIGKKLDGKESKTDSNSKSVSTKSKSKSEKFKGKGKQKIEPAKETEMRLKVKENLEPE